MLSGFTTEWLNTLNAYIERLERSFLETMTPDTFALIDLLDERKRPFFRIRGLADFWSASAGIDVAQHITDLVIGAHNRTRSALTLVLASTPEELSLSLSLGNANTTTTLLTGLFPGIRLDPTPPRSLAQQLEPHFQIKGLLTGIPSSKDAALDRSSNQDHQPSSSSAAPASRRGHQEPAALERLVRGMRGATWGYIVQAMPIDRQEVAQARLALVDLLANVSSQSRVQTQATEQKNLQVTAAETSSNMRTMSSEVVNYRAQYLMRLLERELERLDQAMATGQWMSNVYFGAHTPEDAQRLASLLMGTLGGKASRPDPLRTYFCRRGAAHLQHFQTPMSSEEIALLMQLPREEVPGFAIHDFVRFDTDFSPPARQGLALGAILQQGHPTHSAYQITLDDLTKHALVAGVTGSGKTTTVMNLLDSAVEANRPFLVIEPAKTEYRALHRALAGRAELRVYTLGNELVAPFRLNPFEFETDDTPEHSSLLNHIDFLKAVFNAAFILYAPMPYVLETALHEVYEDKGWDLASGSNTRLPDWQERHLHPIFPSLTDLYRKVEAVTTRLGYHDEIERNVKAGLKARIGSMRLGAKGLMLDTARGITMHQLLAHPTVLELENIGSDDEKTFLMGILLARLYEYRRLQAAAGTIAPGLQHLLVFEEAHRLLKNTETSVDVESSNMRAQAIEVFTNMLSEVRAYGQGVLVAEQIPSKLAPDVLKNTNLKIAHRITAQDDRESVGQTMNLTAEQMTHLGVLQPGVAAVYAEGADHAYLVQMNDYKRQLTPLTNTALRELSPGYASVAAYQAIRDVQQYALPCSPFGGPAAKAYQDAGIFLESEKSREWWATLLLRAAFAPASLPELISNRLAREIEAALPALSDQQHQVMARVIVVRGCAETLHERGAQAGWPYPLIESLRQHLTQTLLTIVDSGDLSQAESDLQPFATLYKEQMRRKQGPFPGCSACQARCLYRAEVQRLLSVKDRKWVEDDLKSTRYPTQKERFGAIAKAVTEKMARLWLGMSVPEEKSVGYCAALHATAQSGYTEYEQTLVGGYLAEHLSPDSSTAGSESGSE
jgi:hypothetical protein